jgi:hypothetical protein
MDAQFEPASFALCVQHSAMVTHQRRRSDVDVEKGDAVQADEADEMDGSKSIHKNRDIRRPIEPHLGFPMEPWKAHSCTACFLISKQSAYFLLWPFGFKASRQQ